MKRHDWPLTSGRESVKVKLNRATRRMMKKKGFKMEVPVRTIDEIRKEYTQVCGRLGDMTYRASVLAQEIENAKQTLSELNVEASKLDSKEKADEPVPEVPTPTV